MNLRQQQQQKFQATLEALFAAQDEIRRTTTPECIYRLGVCHGVFQAACEDYSRSLYMRVLHTQLNDYSEPRTN